MCKLFVGKKLVLVNNPPHFKLNKYPLTVVEIEITEQKDNVPGEFSGKTDNTGYVAKGSDGYLYSYNYPRANEGFSDTCWHRHMEDDAFIALSAVDKDRLISQYIWFDVTSCYRGIIPKFMLKYPYVKSCAKHKTWLYDGDKCFYCLVEESKKEKTV